MDGPVGEPLAGTIANQQFSAAIRTAVFRNFDVPEPRGGTSVNGHVLESRSLGGPANKKKDLVKCRES